jgi:hypothetical protein
VGEEGTCVSATLLWPLRDASFMVVIFKVCSHLGVWDSSVESINTMLTI